MIQFTKSKLWRHSRFLTMWVPEVDYKEYCRNDWKLNPMNLWWIWHKNLEMGSSFVKLNQSKLKICQRINLILWILYQNLSKDGNGFIDRGELGLMLKFSGETFSRAEIQVGLAFSIVPVIVFGFAIVLCSVFVFVIPFVHMYQYLCLCFLLDAIASPTTYPYQWVSESVSGSLIVSPSFASLFDELTTRRSLTGPTLMETVALTIPSLPSWWWTALSDMLLEHLKQHSIPFNRL